ncbi:hypothetical protein L211DRAFT_834764 [Terfezia boudieri ATCC MYA-4762]|uniref:MIP18 family-like domain-containing protein n=1 Tax=Terfezia boudieri ATCC MYA-4762 TaxID=1051890 RepID=A0A3N4LZS9_9PEZI|nr:hypothetical protein L211DRAFT_834764 [Terfezia boudieri ATCC MYA-4762]
MDNENPTILNASDLPSRKRQIKRRLPSGLSNVDMGLLSSIGPTAEPNDPFSTGNVSDPLSSGEDEDSDGDDFDVEQIDEQEIYDLISTISDPEHPLSLGELAVVNLPHIKVTDNQDRSVMSHVLVEITPTITHCSLATVIGLGIRVRLEQALPPRFRLDVRIREGTHSTADQVNKQLNDKERVAAACENESLMAVLRKMLETCK